MLWTNSVTLCLQVFWLQFHPALMATEMVTETLRHPQIRCDSLRLHVMLQLHLVSGTETHSSSSDTSNLRMFHDFLCILWQWTLWRRPVCSFVYFSAYQMPVHSQGDWQSGVMMYLQGDSQTSVGMHQQGGDKLPVHLHSIIHLMLIVFLCVPFLLVL